MQGVEFDIANAVEHPSKMSTNPYWLLADAVDDYVELSLFPLTNYVVPDFALEIKHSLEVDTTDSSDIVDDCFAASSY